MAIEHADRYRRIAVVLGRHGLGFVAAGLDLGHLLPFDGPDRRVSGRSARAREVREALEELGPTFVKLGQLLSTRSDLLPDEYVAELARLQDAAPAVPYPEIAAAVEAELGAPLTARFATFDIAPLASASLGQAHAATLLDGTRVVVKVRRPASSTWCTRTSRSCRTSRTAPSDAGAPPARTTSRSSPRSSPPPCAPSSTTSRRAATPSASPPRSPTTRTSASPPCTGRRRPRRC